MKSLFNMLTMVVEAKVRTVKDGFPCVLKGTCKRFYNRPVRTSCMPSGKRWPTARRVSAKWSTASKGAELKLQLKMLAIVIETNLRVCQGFLTLETPEVMLYACHIRLG